jgi:hypothetical protein
MRLPSYIFNFKVCKFMSKKLSISSFYIQIHLRESFLKIGRIYIKSMSCSKILKFWIRDAFSRIKCFRGPTLPFWVPTIFRFGTQFAGPNFSYFRSQNCCFGSQSADQKILLGKIWPIRRGW